MSEPHIGGSIMNDGQASFLSGRVLVWFSCGAASAVASKLAVEKYRGKRDLEIVNCDTLKDEHEDNPRFMRDVEKWIQWPIKQIRSSLYETCDDVFSETRYMSGRDGARCTTELKKKPRLAYQWREDSHIFGFTSDEQNRIDDFEWNNPELQLEWILRDAGIRKRDCYAILKAAGIQLPEMYLLGYRNNNCRGCVKATSPGYWNKVRKDFPDVFDIRASRSRELGCRLVRLKGERIFLDELPPGVGKYKGEDLSCGPACNPEKASNA